MKLKLKLKELLYNPIKAGLIILGVIACLGVSYASMSATTYQCFAYEKNNPRYPLPMKVKDATLWISVEKNGSWLTSGLLTNAEPNIDVSTGKNTFIKVKNSNETIFGLRTDDYEYQIRDCRID
ncbi:hypothetical protein KKZ75_19260 [Enterobacter hormaechei subsp. xiangfangensis]|nr:hypothetical protein [Enterobacter hormaechei subsp. xiangfangensis]